VGVVALTHGASICVTIIPMENRRSQDARDVVVRAALDDAATLGATLADEYRATYQGADRALYLSMLATWIADIGAALEDGPGGPIACFADRRIVISFTPEPRQL
jgi:hypothetical protein